jgi:hypothetical protein
MLFLTIKFTPRTVIFPLVFLVVLINMPLSENYRQLRLKIDMVIQKRFYPFYEFGEYISYDDEMLMYVSPTIPAGLGFFSRDLYTMYTIFDLHFGENSLPRNFTYSPKPEKIFDHILAGEFDYVFLTERDWKNLHPSIDPTPQIATVCEIFHDQGKPLVFLDCN